MAEGAASTLFVVRVGMLELQNDLVPAGWAVDRIHDFGVDVGSVIPEGFGAYVRLFHPASSSWRARL